MNVSVSNKSVKVKVLQSGGGGSSIPGSVDYAYIVAQNKVGLNDAITGPTSFALKVVIPENPTYPYTLAGGLSLTAADTLSFTDGTNTATLTTTLPAAGEEVIVMIDIDPGYGSMRLGDVSENDFGLFAAFGDTSHTKSLVSATTTDFSTVANVVSGANGLYLSATNSEPTHCNSALYTEYNASVYRSFEITVGNNPTNARICFGTDIDNFVFIVLSNGSPYSVKDGTFYATVMNGYGARTLITGDRVRLTFFGTSAVPVVQMHVNDAAISAQPLLRADVAATLPNGPVYPGVAWRDFANTWYSTSIEVSEVSPPRYMHLSFDDFLQPLVDAEDLDSIWDQENFALLKRLHYTYGAKFSLFCFVTNGTVSITSITSKHKDELQAASEWLKFGFHAYNMATTYNYGISAATAKEHYDTVIEAIKVFAGQGSIDPMPRIHAFAGTLDQCLAWKESGAVGFLTADDDRVSYYHSAGDNLCMRQCESLHDYVNSVDFIRSSFRLEYSSDVESSISALVNQTGTVKGATNELVIFSHTYLFENCYGSSTGIEAKLEECCAYAVEHEINFDYPYKVHSRGLGNGTIPSWES